MDPETMDRRSHNSLCENLCWPFGQAPGGKLGHFWAQKMGGGFINFIRNLWFSLVLEVVFGEILVFANIFDFTGLNRAEK